MPQIKEINILIANRVAGSDKWILVGEEIEHPSLTDVLEAYFQKTGEKCSFRLEPMNSKLFAIQTDTEIDPPKRFNIYGDFD